MTTFIWTRRNSTNHWSYNKSIYRWPLFKLNWFLFIMTLYLTLLNAVGKVITSCDSRASVFLHGTFCLSILPFGPQRTGLRSRHLRQQISISHGGCSWSPDTSLAITALLILWLHNMGQISRDRWHCRKINNGKLVTIEELDKILELTEEEVRVGKPRLKIGVSCTHTDHTHNSGSSAHTSCMHESEWFLASAGL